MVSHDYGLSDELKMLQSTVRKFVKNEIIPEEQTQDPDAIKLPEEVVSRLQKKTRAMGMYQPSAPEEYGGAGLDFFSNTIFMEEVSKHRQGLYNAGCEAFGHPIIPILYAGTEAQKGKIPETLCPINHARLFCHHRTFRRIGPGPGHPHPG